MTRITSQALDQLTIGAAAAAMMRRFPVLRRNRDFIHECLEWQESVTPRPNFYFRWHLPRFVITCEFIAAQLGKAEGKRVLDLGSYVPFAILMERFVTRTVGHMDWTRTAFQDGLERYESPRAEFKVPLVGCPLGKESLPFEAGYVDTVILTEVIEHVDCHPQLLLGEINRILSPHGTLLLTTPNSSSLKKLLQLSNGVPQYDSPTFAGSWGHRYEFSYRDIQQCLGQSAFAVEQQAARDVYFDDPAGVGPVTELILCAGAKVLTGQYRKAIKLVSRRGSTLFFAARKMGELAHAQSELLAI